MYQGGSDDFLGPVDDVIVPSEAMGIDFEAEIAVVTGDVKMGSTPEQALDGIRLVMLANDVSLRNLIPAELAKGFGFFRASPPPPSAPWPSRSTSSARPGRTGACTWRCKAAGTAARSACATPAPR